MQKFLRTLTLMALLLVPWVTQAQTLTVADGTQTNTYVPFYGYYADEAQHNQVLYPAADLTAMNGKEITEMVFYVSSYSHTNDWGTWTVSLGETSATSLSSLENATTLTQVFSGEFEATLTSTTLTITFENGYIYNGGNLLLDINHPAGNWSQCSFYGIEATGASYCYGSQWNFLPKTTFTYETPSSCTKPGVIALGEVTGNTAAINWTAGGSETSWNVYLDGVLTSDSPVSTPSYTFTGLTGLTTYSVAVEAICGSDVSSQRTSSFTTLIYCANGSCDLHFVCNDVYGDGWNGGLINVYANGALLSTVTAENHGGGNVLSTDDIYVNVCKGDVISFSYTTGQYGDEVSFDIFDGGGDQVYSVSNPAAGDFLTLTNACPSCYRVLNLTAGNETTSGATLTWEADSRNANATYTVYNVTNDAVYQSGVTGTSITITGLNENSTYEFTVTTDCGDGDLASAVSVEFTTLANCQAPTNVVVDNVTAHTADMTWSGDAGTFNIRYQVSNGLSEGFEGGMPEGWTSEGDGTWSIGTGDYTTSTGTHTGSYNAQITHGTTGDVTYLVTPALNLGSVSQATLKLWYVNRSWSGDIDGFGVFYRVNGGEWNELFSTTEAHSTYTELNLNLTGLANNYQLGFRMQDAYGYGVALDDIEVVVPNDSWTTATANTNSYNITGLAGETKYLAQVQRVCSGGVSDWSEAVNFTTLVACPAPTALVAGGETTNSVALSWTENGEATAWQICVDGDEDNLVTANTNPFTLTGLAEYTEYSLKVRANCGGIDGVSAWSSAITATTLANCQAVQNLAYSNVTSTGATLTWTDPNSGSNVYTVTNVTTNEVLTTTLTTATYEVTGLDPNTNYTFSVAVNCGSATSDVATVALKTACGVIDNLPITYGFESGEGFSGSTSNYTTNTIGDCWRNEATVQNGNNPTRLWSVNSSSSYVHTGSQSLKLADKGSSSNPAKTMLVFPPMNFTATNGYVVSFWIYRNASSTNPEGFKVYASNTDTIDDNAVYLGHYSRNYGIAYPTVELASGWYQYETDPIMMTGTVYLIFEGQSYYGNATYVDDVTIKVAPTCFKPTAFAAENVTVNGATLTWTRDTRNADGETYSILDVNDQVVPGAENISGTSFQLTGLNEFTDYTFKVRTNCADPTETVNDMTVTFQTLANCQAVENLVASDVVANGLTLNWTDPNDPGNTYTITNVTTNEVLTTNCATTSFDVTGLDPQTGYTFSVVVNCASSSSAATTVNVTTPCAAVSVPFTENFDGYTTSTTTATGVQPDCWTLAYKDVTWTAATYNPQVCYSASNAHSGSYSLRLYYRGIYAMPPVDVNVNQLQMNFWVKQPSASYQLVVGVMSDLNDESTFVPVETINCASTSASEEHTVYFNEYTGNGRYIAFRNITTNTYNYSYNYIDDITVDYLPSCYPVSNLAANVTSNSVTLNWTDASNSGATYTVYDMSDNSVVAANVNATTYTVGNLTPTTLYEFGVKANCSDTDESTVVTISAQTSCAPVPIPFIEDFSATLNSDPCWRGATGVTAAEAFAGTSLTLTAPSVWTYQSSVNNGIEGGHYKVNIYGASCKKWLITPEIDLTTAPSAQLSFDAAFTVYSASSSNPASGFENNSSQAFMVLVSTDNSATWLESNAIKWQNEGGQHTLAELASSEYINQVINLNQYLGQTIRIAFYAQSTTSGGDNNLHIDNIAVTEVPNCFAVTDLTASDVTTNSVVLTWSDTENEGASYTVKNGDVVVESGISTTTYTVANLTPNTDYTFAVVANCAVDAQPVTVNVHTLCEAATLPFAENFEENSETVNCWDYVSNNTANIGGNNGMGFVTLNGKRMWRFSSYSSASDYNQYAYSQPLSVEAGAQYLEYYVRYGTYGANDHLWFGYIDANDNEVWTDEYYTTGGSNNPTFAVYKGTIPATAKKVAIHYYGSFAYYAWIDSVNVKVKNVFEPTDLVASNISNNSVTLTWTRDTRNNGAETYTITNGTEIVATGINANNYVATIQPNTDYNFNVFAVLNNENSDAESVDLGVYEFPTEPGKMVAVSGTILNNYNENTTVTLYRGLGDNLTEQSSYTSSTYLTSDITNYTTSNDWPNVGPMTVIFVGEDATGANTGVANLTASKVCPYYVETPATLVETANGAYTWTTPQGVVYNYENHRNADLAVNENGSIVATYTDTVRNAGDCDSIINTLQLTLHPDFTINVTDQFCEGTTYTVGSGDEAQSFTASVQQNVLLHSVTGADSVIVLNLQMNPSPVAYINNKANDVVNNFCDQFDLVLNARSNMEGVTFQWEDATTDAVRTVNPHESNLYTLIAIDPTTGCQSITPATLTVNTTPVPSLTIDATAEEVCYGQSTTLTINDANNVNATYRWSNNQTGNSITVTPTASTTYTVTATSETGNCVVTAEKAITVNPLPIVTVSTDVNTICANSTLTLTATPGLNASDIVSYHWSTGGTTAVTTTNPTVSGNYTVTVSDENGCVNEFTSANVTVYPVYDLNAERSACQEMLPITWGSRLIESEGNYVQTFQTINGCDSVVRLAFTIDAMPTENSYAEYCEGATFTFGEAQYTATSDLAQVSYIDNSNTCPVNMVQHLTIHPVRTTTVPLTVCDKYVWNLTNEMYTESGDYNTTLATIHGCDSVVTLALTVNKQNTGIDLQTACDQFVWDLNGQTYTASTNEPVVTLTGANAFGCDSVVTLNLTVNYKSFYTDNVLECNSTSYTWIDGESYNLSVTPDDNITHVLDVENAAGCDSIAILNLTMNYVLDTLNWVDVNACDNYYIDVVTCEGEIVREYISESGDVIRRTRNAETGRDRMSRIHLTITASDYVTVPVTACVPYDWQVTDNLVIAGINPVANDTVISQELETEFGCSVIKVLRLHALRHTEHVTPVTLCQTGSWTDGNDSVYQMADYQLGENEPILWNTTTNVAGCDSTDYVVFTVNPVYNETAVLTLCENEFTNNAYTLVNANDNTQSVELTIPGALNETVYTDSVVANWITAAGCDSIVTITYTVNPVRSEEVTEQNCYTYTWNGSTYTASGDYTFNTQTVDGCDSTATLHLTITDTVYGEVTYNVCGEFDWEGVIYRESKTFTVFEDVPTAAGCDSVTYHIFNLTPRVMRDHYVTTNIPYTWVNGQTYTANVNNLYYDATEPGGCDSILVLHLNWVNDTVVICENEVPYSGNGITINNVTVNIEEGFENGMPEGWTFVDNDGDGHNWIDYQLSYGNHYYVPNTGERSASSASYINGVGSLNTDNWMIMPQIPADQNTVLSWYSRFYQNDYPDSYTVMVSTTGNAPADFTDVVFNGNSETDAYTHHTVDLSSYAGQNIYVAFRHNDYDMYWLFIDDVNLNGSSVYTASENFHDTILYYVVNRNTTKETEVTACNSYTWAENNTTYNESGSYTITGLTNANGCDSTHTLVLTINSESGSNSAVTVCDSYTWNATGNTYTLTESGVYYDTTLNAGGCTNIDTLNLTINSNPGVEQTSVACDSFVWNGQTYTESGTYSVNFSDANGCTADSVLYLTVNTSNDSNLVVIRNEASTYYNGNYYPAQNYQGDNPDSPYTFDVLHVGANANNCDSVDHVTLYVTRGYVHDTIVNMCGQYTWNRNGNTYAWINDSVRQANGNALYMDVTNNSFIHTGENPIYMELDNNGIAINTYVLWLNLTEANYFNVDLGTILLSNQDSIIVNPGDSLDYKSIDLSSYIAARANANMSVVVEHTSTWYCKNVVTYTANLVYNYDTLDAVTLCDETSYTDNTYNVTFDGLIIGAANHRDFVVDEGTANEMHYHIVINVTERLGATPQVVDVCDSYTWTAGTGMTYTTSGIYTWNNDATCAIDSLKLNIRYSNSAVDTQVACDSFTWIDGVTYTENNNTAIDTILNVAGCDSVVTLNLTINVNNGIVIPDVVACDSYDWDAPNDSTYHLTESQMFTIDYADANTCVGPATLYLTINVNEGIRDSVAACSEYTWSYLSLNEYTGRMDTIEHEYVGGDSTGIKNYVFLDANGCEGIATLDLTIYDPINTNSERFEYGNGCTFHNRFYTPRVDGGDSVYVIIYDTVDAHNCAILDTMNLHVMQYQFFYTNKVECGSYTWPVTYAGGFGNGHSYRSMTDDEIAAYPTALYFDVTLDTPVYSNPRFYTPNSNRVDELRLTLNRPSLTVINDTILKSQLANMNYSFSTVHGTITCYDAENTTVDTNITYEFNLGPITSCEDIVRYNLYVIYNYYTDSPITLCHADNYEVTTGDVRTLVLGNNNLTYSVNAGTANEEIHTVTIVNNDYTPATPQQVTECDSYTWTAGTGATYTTSGNYVSHNDNTCVVDTLNLTINYSNSSIYTAVACDSYTWNGTLYNESNTTDTMMVTNAAGCDSIVTLNLTVNYSNGSIYTAVACDSYTWNGTLYTESNTTDTMMFTNVAGCDSIVTLNLTINAHQDNDVYANACVSYTWADNNNTTYSTSGDYSRSIVDDNNCAATETLHLTINQHVSADREFWFGDGSYRYSGIYTAVTGQLFEIGTYNVSETVYAVTPDGCDSIYSITLHVGNNYDTTEAVRACYSYTWARNGHTYVRLTDEQHAADTTALFYDATAATLVYYNPVHVEPRANDFADEYMLDLTLDAIITRDSIINVPVSMGSVTCEGRTYTFNMSTDEGRMFIDSTIYDTIHIPAIQYCDSIVYLTINVTNNYNNVVAENADICMSQTSYTWRNHTISTVNSNYDSLYVYYIYDVVGDAVDYITVTQHPYSYTTERRTACDSYEWYGRVYTESTSNAASVTINDRYGCDSVVTLVLTINHNSSTTFGSEAAPVKACDSYTWTLANGDVVPTTYTMGGVYTMAYTSLEGCPSVDTLYLAVNHSDAVEVEESACDTYTWADAGTYTTSGVYTHTFANVNGCDSVVTLNLTINNSDDIVYDGPVSACDSYEWHGMTWNGTEMVDTIFNTFTEGASSLTATAYNQYGCAIPHFISLLTISTSNAVTTAEACDSYTWSVNGETYTESGTYTFVSPTTDACGNFTDSLYLTINKNTNHAEEVAICNVNLPAGGYEWNGNFYTTTGVYTYDYIAENGCPSTDTLKFSIGTMRTFNRIYVEHCGPYTWDLTGETFDNIGYVEASTIYENANYMGCDSLVYLYLTIHEQPVVNETAVVCDNQLPFSWRGMTFTAAGVDTVHAAFSEHCDSLYIMTLTVNERTSSSTSDIACDSYTWNGSTYTTSGVYTYTTANALGCDSTVTLDLTINNNSGHANNVAWCDSYTWIADNGTEVGTYNLSGSYYYNYIDGNGCASVDTLNLAIANGVVNNIVVSVCDEYTWIAIDGTEVGTYNESGNYTYNYVTSDGCSGTEILGLTVRKSSTSDVVVAACDSYNWFGTVYDESGVYTNTITNVAGCDSVITLKLTINESSESEETAAACNFYTWTSGNGLSYLASGDYSFTTPNAMGCDSTVTLHLTINAPVTSTIDTAVCGMFTWNNADGISINYDRSQVITNFFYGAAANGCDSTEVINLTIKTVNAGFVYDTVCDSYTWDATGITYTESINDYKMLEGAGSNGCDSICYLFLTVNHSSSNNTVANACDSYDWNGTTYDASGVYTYAYNSVEGCPSVDSLILTVNNSVENSISDEACNYYLWNNLGYNQSGVYTQTFTAANGCDSVVTLNLTINTQVSSDFSAEACNSYSWNGSTYTATGAYVQHFSSVAGCDSVVTLNLTIKNGVQNTISTSVCNSYTWNDQTYTAPGTYTQSFTAANGCDSIVTLNLSFYSAVENNINVSACDSYTWNNQTYTTSGVYTQGFSAVNGCDSIVTMNLTINHNGGSYTSLAVCNGYTWNNTTYNASGIYTHVSNDVNGCSGIDTLNLTILQPTSSTTSVTACVSYAWNGNTYVASGSYIYTTVAANGCDSVATLNLTINQPTSSSTFVSACNSYIWNGNTYNASGSYTYNTVAANGCDSVATLNLTINQPKYSSVTVTACNSYIWNGNTYVASGDYTHNTVAYDGCDSIVTLHLTINQSTSSIVEVTTCGSFTWIDGQYYTASTTTPTVTLVNANGCDSVVTLHLTINQPLTGDAYATACSSYTWEGTTYTVSGNYTHTYTAANGCDSVVTLHLTINQPVASSITATACSSYTWGDATYTTSGDYTRTYTAANGCDSVVTLHLTINQPVATSFAQTACVSYTWEGTTYTTSGNYTHTYTAANGCDSVVTMMLTINQPVSSTIYATACDSYTWDGNTYVVSGTYTQTYTAANNCDSVVTLVLTINNSVSTIDEVSECDGFIWIDNVNYTESTNTPTVVLRNYNGCDSIVTLHLTINHSVEVYDSIEIYENQLPYNYNGNIIEVEGDYMISGTTVNGCDSTVYLHVGVIAVQAINVVSDLENITVYPNPTHGQSTITADDVETIEVYDIVGHLVAKFENTNHIDITNLAEGTYTLRIITTNGTAVRRLVKK